MGKRKKKKNIETKHGDVKLETIFSLHAEKVSLLQKKKDISTIESISKTN